MSVYPNYKDSGVQWIGDIPSHWRLERAKFHFSERNERGNATPTLLAATQKYGMYPQELVEGVVKVADGTDMQQFKTVHVGDFVISLRSFQGGFERSDYEGVCSPAYQVFSADNQWNTDYLKFLFKNELFVDSMNSLTVGIREGRNIKYSDFANSILAIPPIEEQHIIADYLNKTVTHIDNIIIEAKASIEEYKAWKASIIYEAVTKGIDPNVEMKDSGVEWISTIPCSWSCERLKRLFDFGKGLPITKENLIESGYPVISYGQIHSKKNSGTHISDDLIRFVSDEYLHSNKDSLARKNDFLIADTSEDLEGCGNAVYVDSDNPIFAGYHTIILRSKVGKIDNKYLAYLFKTDIWRQQIRSRVSGVKLFSISKKILNQITVILPSADEQAKIVTYLDKQCSNIDAIISYKERLINDLESYKKSLIFEVVTGKRRVC